MRTTRLMAWTGAVALIFAALLGAPGTMKAADDPHSQQVFKLMAAARSTALQLKNDAAIMQEFSKLDIKWEAHGDATAKMREHVIAMNEAVAELNALKDSSQPWQKAVIERITPYMTAMAEDNEAAMDHFDEHASLFGTEASRMYLDANAAAAGNLAALIVNFVENGTIRQMILDYDEIEDAC